MEVEERGEAGEGNSALKYNHFKSPRFLSLPPHSLYLSLAEKPHRFDEDSHLQIDDLPGHSSPRPPSSVHVDSRCTMVVLGQP